MSFSSRRQWKWIGPALAFGMLLNPVRAAEREDPAAEQRAATSEEPVVENPTGEASGIAEDDAKKPEGQPRPAAQLFPQVWQFNGRFRAFLRRNVAAPAMATEVAEEQGDGARSVVLPDNGDMRRQLEKIKAQLADGHFADAAKHLGQLLESPETRDFFLTQGEDRRDYRSFHAEIRTLIGSLPAEGRTAYLIQFEAVAKQQLAAALMAGGESGLRDVVRRFPLTSAAREALYRLAHYLWEHGRPEAAIGCLERLRGDPVATETFEPGFSRLLAECRQRVGQRRQASEGVDGWTTYRGNSERNRSVDCGPPLLAARWTRSVAGDPLTQRSIDQSMRAYREGREIYFPLLHPLAVDNLVLTRTARGVAAYDVTTGDSAWQHPTDDDDDNSGYDRLLWHESAGGAFSADPECFYLLDSRRGADETPAGVVNTLEAREHFQSRQGRLRWRVGGDDGGDEPALAGVAFLGPPLSWQGRLYAEVEGKGAISLVVLDAQSGRLEWAQELALVEQPLRSDSFRRVAGATPSISVDEIIFCPTSGGTVVAVDLTTQSLLWAYRYTRRPQTSSDGIADAGDETAPTRIDQRDRWLDGTVSIGRDCVVLTPPESADLHCLDLRDGRQRWSKPRGEGGLFVACLTDRFVVIVDKTQVRALHLADGQPAWSTAIPKAAFVSGRGVFSGNAYYLPVTSGGIVQFDVSTGAIAAEHASVRETAPGNLIWHRGMFVSLGPDYLQAFEERDAVERRIGETLAKEPGNAAALMGRGDLELSAGRLDDALATFRAAHAAEPSARTRSRLTSALLDAVRREGPQGSALLEELDRLSVP